MCLQRNEERKVPKINGEMFKRVKVRIQKCQGLALSEEVALQAVRKEGVTTSDTSIKLR